MATTEEATKRCPRCEAPLDQAAFALGRPFRCAKCGARVQRRPGADEPPPRTDVPAERDESLLATIEDVLIKMIYGVFRFILIKVPQEIYGAVVRWFPTIVRLVRIMLLLAAWLVLVGGPACIRYLSVEYRPPWWPELGTLLEFYWEHAAVFDGLIVVYTALAVCGSAWGVLYIRRRRKQARAEQAAESRKQSG